MDRDVPEPLGAAGERGLEVLADIDEDREAARSASLL